MAQSKVLVFHKNLFKILVSRVKSFSEQQNLFKALLHDKNCTSARVFSTRS